MPEHVVESSDFWIKAPAPIEKVLADAKKSEAAAEKAAEPPKQKPLEIPKVPTAKEAEDEVKASKGEGPPMSVKKEEAKEEAAAAAEAPAAFVQMYAHPHYLS